MKMKLLLSGILGFLLVVMTWAGLSLPVKESGISGFPVPVQAEAKTIYATDNVTYTYTGWLTRYKLKVKRSDWAMVSETKTEWVFEKNGDYVKLNTLPDGFHLEKMVTKEMKKNMK